MATIALYADKINQMPGLIRDVKKSVLNYKGQLRSFAQNGNKLVDFGRFAGKGKSIFGDILIGKGTIIHVIRPTDLLTLGAKINISIPAGIFGGGITTIFSGLQSD